MSKHPVLLSLLLTSLVCTGIATAAALGGPSSSYSIADTDAAVAPAGTWSPVVYWDEWPDSITAAPAVVLDTAEATEVLVAIAEPSSPVSDAEPGHASAPAAPAARPRTPAAPTSPKPAPAPAPAPKPTPPPAPAPAPTPPPAPAAPEVIGGYGSSIAKYINPSASYDSGLAAQCVAQAKRMALAGSLSHSSYAPESCARFGGGLVALSNDGGGVAGGLYGHCPQLGECSRIGVGLVLYNGTLYAVAQGGS